jgi:hypothetical protein
VILIARGEANNVGFLGGTCQFTTDKSKLQVTTTFVEPRIIPGLEVKSTTS